MCGIPNNTGVYSHKLWQPCPGGPADPWHGYDCLMHLKMATIKGGNLIIAPISTNWWESTPMQ